MDWIGSKVLYIKIFTAIFVRPIKKFAFI